MAVIGYVVVEYNQASYQAGIPFGADIHQNIPDAVLDKQQYERFAAAAGRREQYAVATLGPDEEEED